MAFERQWDDELQAYRYAKGESRKTLDTHIAVTMDDADKRPNAKSQANPTNNHQNPSPSKGNDDTSAPASSVPKPIEYMRSDGGQVTENVDGTITITYPTNSLDSQQSDQPQTCDYKPQSDSQNQSQGSQSQQPQNSLSDDDIFDRWNVEAYNHFVYFVNKASPWIHVRFAHSIHVPHLGVEINTKDLDEIVPMTNDIRYMRDTRFRKVIINPLLEDTYLTKS